MKENKLKHKDHFHGSDLEKIELLYGVKKENIVSFSANVNPLGISPKLKATLSDHLDDLAHYPDREYKRLRETIGDYCSSPADNIIVGNGSTELISILIELKKPKKAMILGPSYSEYEREVSLAGGASLYFPLKESDNFELNIEKLEKHLNEDIDLLIICNPNNPTSTCIKRRDMRTILDLCKILGIFVMVDETYIEFVENMDEVDDVPLTQYYNNLFIIRGISKFFAAPGLRLGYAITGNEDLIRQIYTRKNPWAINTLAEIAGNIMFTDHDYISQTKELIVTEKKRICTKLDALSSLGLKYFSPSANFVLCKLERSDITADNLFDNCIRQEMMIRNCSTFPFLDNRFFRFCFMKPEQNDRLIECIADSLRS
ncbi:MAG: aminotransferase class I/II-fold pyridoxal phosphate-dependent enzyme [Lachnospiraceae bacterium]|nr:aminotransferase class I/II-fold pyridoxal phosphate-dependent enzyme [Lachnospiraceae bacterium]